MKKIEPVQVWKNGESQEANLLNAYIVSDNLKSACCFYYSLNASQEATKENQLIIGQVLAEGNLSMSEDEYIAWDGSNDYPFTYIAEKLNLTII